MFTPVITCQLPEPFQQYVLAYGTLQLESYCQAVGAIRLLTPEGAIIPMQMRVKKTLRQIIEKLQLEVPLINPNTERQYTTPELGRKVLEELEQKGYLVRLINRHTTVVKWNPGNRLRQMGTKAG